MTFVELIRPILTKAAEAAVGALVSQEITKLHDREPKTIQHGLNFQEERTCRSLEEHIRFVESWSGKIELLGMSMPKHLEDIYVQLVLSEEPRSVSLGEPPAQRYQIDDILRLRRNAVILGDLGSGKTTTLRKVALDILGGRMMNPTFRIPIVLRLREFREHQTLFQSLERILTLKFTECSYPLEPPRPVSDGTTVKKRPPEEPHFEPFGLVEARGLSEFLNRIGACILLDGFDELNQSSRGSLIEELEVLSLALDPGRLLLSSRSADFSRKPAQFVVFEIRPLEDSQIQRLVTLWFASEKVRRHTPEQFFDALHATPYSDLCKRPLALANLCLVFDKYGALPDLPITVYRKIINLLLEEWDAERGITRQSRYARFDSQRKLDFLAALAYQLVLRRVPGTSFNQAELRDIYLKICKRFNLPDSEAIPVCKEIESHTGIIVKASYDRFEFSHKSLQEYLVAEYLIRLRDIPSAIDLLRACPNELAIAVALSSDPTDWFCGLFRYREGSFRGTRVKPKPEWILIFLSRIAYERPGFEESAELGATCLWMFERCEEVVLDKRIKCFTDIATVQAAITTFLGYTDITVGARVRIRLREPFESKYPVAQRIEFRRETAAAIPGLCEVVRSDTDSGATEAS